jgi:hypothetical protein
LGKGKISQVEKEDKKSPQLFLRNILRRKKRDEFLSHEKRVFIIEKKFLTHVYPCSYPVSERRMENFIVELLSLRITVKVCDRGGKLLIFRGRKEEARGLRKNKSYDSHNKPRRIGALQKECHTRYQGFVKRILYKS